MPVDGVISVGGVELCINESAIRVNVLVVDQLLSQ